MNGKGIDKMPLALGATSYGIGGTYGFDEAHTRSQYNLDEGCARLWDNFDEKAKMQSHQPPEWICIQNTRSASHTTYSRGASTKKRQESRRRPSWLLIIEEQILRHAECAMSGNQCSTDQQRRDYERSNRGEENNEDGDDGETKQGFAIRKSASEKGERGI
ncbi:hypothetical protein M5K25_015366 [Dendrobium thyrsiflorum]|uniref:Uncharacterized protein n=1 Tax=Dendrobium thyrsiflorum TaxID=117978 RepID=A0ABD0UQL1_DENTH